MERCGGKSEARDRIPIARERENFLSFFLYIIF